MQKQVLRGEKCTDLLKSEYTEVSIWLQLFLCIHSAAETMVTVKWLFQKKPLEVKTGQAALSQAATQVMKEIQGHNSTLYILWDFYKFYEPDNRSIGSLCRFFPHPESAHAQNRFLQQGRKNQLLADFSVSKNFLWVILIKFMWTKDSFLSHSYSL